MIGKTLGHYQITSQLGKGGMGEVYQAKDQKLGRDVAIKVLPEEFAKDADRIARFQREAKLLASLNHPNIAAIHGLEESGETNFLVLELVEGETLADQIKRGSIPVEESLKLALQIAEALEAAHEKGVIHRDLKPANIKITPDGKVKVLDFGLAKALASELAELNPSNSPTLSNAATQQGVILGTAAYMSPEQAKGKIVDKRADVWAFGCVVFEMLTGRSVFSADDVSQTLARVLERQPDFSLLPSNLHSRIIQLLERCLEKNAQDRYSSISDARVDIQRALADPNGLLARPITGAEPRSRLRTMLPWAVAALVLGLIIAGVAVWKQRTPEPRQVARFYYELPQDQQSEVYSLAVSPDGKQIVHGTSKGLYLRSVDDLTAKLIAGTEGSVGAFFSPDSKWIGYFSRTDRKLKKIAVTGGAPVALCDARTTQLSAATWSEDNTIVFTQLSGEIMRISADGGIPASFVKAKSGILADAQILPGGKSVLYMSVDASFGRKIVVQSLKSGETKELFAGANARYIPTGHIVYGMGPGPGPGNATISAIPFDLDKLEITGGAVPLVNNVARYAVSNSGTLIYTEGNPLASSIAQRTLVWIDRNGIEEPLEAAPNAYFCPRVSPNGTQVAVTIGGITNSSIWIWDLVRKNLSKLTLEETDDLFPLWTPDGERIVFSKRGKGGNGVYWKAANGSGSEALLDSVKDGTLLPCSWSKDGKTLILEEASAMIGLLIRAPMGRRGGSRSDAGGRMSSSSPTTLGDISALPMDGNRARKALLQGKFLETHPQISPDGRWMAYTSNESGPWQVYVRPFPQVDSWKQQVSTNGGSEPGWSPDGREVFYRSSGTMMAVAVQTEPTFKAGAPKMIFRDTYYSLQGRQWDLDHNGKRFLMIKPLQPTSEESAAPPPRKINIVLNWFEELKQRVPAQ